jgi:transglutaminase-like putative cysteine protease
LPARQRPPADPEPAPNVPPNFEEEAMSIKRVGWLALLLWAPSLAAAEPPGQLIEETWEVAHIEGVKVGSVHTTVRALEDGGSKRLRTTAELELNLKRHQALLRLRMENGTEETPEGKVGGVFMRQFHDKGQQLVLTGTLEEDRMHVRIDNGRIDRKLRWGEDIVGLYRRDRLFQEKKPKPGDRFSYLTYDPTVNAVVTIQVAVKEEEEVDLLGKRQRLLRVELTPDKLVVPGMSVQLPASVLWLDKEWVPLKRQIEMEGLGVILLTRTTREIAQAPPSANARTLDIGLKALVPLDRSISRPHATRAVVYRITLKGDPDPLTAIAEDNRQEIKNAKGNTFELHVRAVRRPMGDDGKAEAPPEYLASCHYINSDDAKVKELARKAVGTESDPWKKAQRIERWVKQNMRVDNAAPLVPAGTIARELRGDCRLYALLTAALCRAEGIPSRVAVGLIYVEKGQKPQMGFHAWTEVWANGQWLGIDATLGQGSIGAAHVKIADHSWNDVQSLTPLLPVNRILGKVAIEVVSVEAGE